MNLKVILLPVFVVILVKISQNSIFSKANLTAGNYDEVVIGGLFSLHGERRKNQSTLCGNVRLDGYEEVNAMLFAVNKINENPSILPGITLRVKLDDTCSSIEVATERTLNHAITKFRSEQGCSVNQSIEDRPVLAIVGERDSDISRAVTNLAGLFHIPVISYGSTSPSLTGMKYFLRTIPSDTFIAQATVDFLMKFQWNYIVLLHSDSEYGRFAADAFRNRLRKERRKICIAVDEAFSAGDTREERRIWKKMEKELGKTKVVVVFAAHEDFSSFLKTGKEGQNLKQYIWLSDDLWTGQTSNVTNELKYAISIIPHHVYIQEFANFLDNTHRNLGLFENFSDFKREWFNEFHTLPEMSHMPRDTCLPWHSSQVSFVMDSVYAIAWGLHDMLQCKTNISCRTKRNQDFTGDILSAIKNVNFKNPWTGNQVSFTDNGNPRNVVYAVFSLQQTQTNTCFRRIGLWRCLVRDNKTCTGNLILKETIFKSNISISKFLGVCGVVCPPGKYKVVDNAFASCCWQCKNCSENKYTEEPGSAYCNSCTDDQWPNANHTACIKVEPNTLTTSHPATVIILTICALGIILVLVLILIIIKFSHSRMKIFSDPLLCYLLLFGILTCYVSSIFVLTDNKKKYCLLSTFLSKIGLTCTTATLFIKTNNVYRTYKKKILKDNPRFLSQGLQVFVVIALVTIDAILTWLSVNFGGTSRKTSEIVYFQTSRKKIAYLQCGCLVNIFSKNLFTMLEFSFSWGLLLICVHQAYLTRRITDSSHGLRYVFFGSFAALVNSILTLLAYSFTDSQGNNKELIFSVHHTFFASVALACIFIPKVDILVFHPEKDALHDALNTTVTLNADSLFRLSRKKFIPEMSVSSPDPQT